MQATWVDGVMNFIFTDVCLIFCVDTCSNCYLGGLLAVTVMLSVAVSFKDCYADAWLSFKFCNMLMHVYDLLFADAYSDFVYGCHADAWFCCHMLPDACLNRLRHTCFWLLRWCLLGWVVLLIATLTLHLFQIAVRIDACFLMYVAFAENLCWRLVIILCWHLLIIGCWADSYSDCYAYSCLFCCANSCLWFLFWCLLVFLVSMLACFPCADVRLFFSCRWC